MRGRFRFLVVMLLCLASVFGGPIVSSYAADDACMSQMAGHGDGTPDCDSCDGAPAGHMQHECCFVAASVALAPGATPSAPIGASGQKMGAVPPGYRSIASSPGLQPPR
jgi:hypothetical protein